MNKENESVTSWRQRATEKVVHSRVVSRLAVAIGAASGLLSGNNNELLSNTGSIGILGATGLAALGVYRRNQAISNSGDYMHKHAAEQYNFVPEVTKDHCVDVMVGKNSPRSRPLRQRLAERLSVSSVAVAGTGMNIGVMALTTEMPRIQQIVTTVFGISLLAKSALVHHVGVEVPTERALREINVGFDCVDASAAALREAYALDQAQ